MRPRVPGPNCSTWSVFSSRAKSASLCAGGGIHRDLKEALDDLSDRGRDESIRRAFSKLSRISRQLWRESDVEPLCGR